MKGMARKFINQFPHLQCAADNLIKSFHSSQIIFKDFMQGNNELMINFKLMTFYRHAMKFSLVSRFGSLNLIEVSSVPE